MNKEMSDADRRRLAATTFLPPSLTLLHHPSLGEAIRHGEGLQSEALLPLPLLLNMCTHTHIHAHTFPSAVVRKTNEKPIQEHDGVN